MQREFLTSLKALMEREVTLSPETSHALHWAFSQVRASDHEDMLQRILLECVLIVGREKDKPKVLPDAELRRAIWRVAKQYYRMRRPLSLDVDVPAPESVPAEDRQPTIESLFKSITPFDTLVLQELLEERTPKEIGEKLNISLSTYYRSASRIRDALKAMHN